MAVAYSALRTADGDLHYVATPHRRGHDPSPRCWCRPDLDGRTLGGGAIYRHSEDEHAGDCAAAAGEEEG